MFARVEIGPVFLVLWPVTFNHISLYFDCLLWLLVLYLISDLSLFGNSGTFWYRCIIDENL